MKIKSKGVREVKFSHLYTCIGFVIFLSACGDNSTPEEHISKAKAYIESNELNASEISLKNAIRLAPDNGEARFMLGKLYLSNGRGTEAVKELERANSLQYEKNKVVPLLARAYFLTESDDDTLGLAAEVLNLSDEAQCQYLVYKTIAALRTNQADLAKKSVAQAQSILPTNVYTLLAIAYQDFSQKKFTEAKLSVDQILALEPKNPDTLLLQGHIATSLNDFPQAIKSYKQYSDAQPMAGVAMFFIAQALLSAEEFAEAEKYADAILVKASNQPFAHYIKAMGRFYANDYSKAYEHAEAALTNKFDRLDLKVVAGASAFYLKNHEQSYYRLTPIIKYLPVGHAARKMLALSQFQLGYINELTEDLSTLDEKTAQDAEFLSSLSFKLLEIGAIDQAEQVTSRLVGIPSSDAKQNARNGMLKLMSNDFSGIQDLKTAITLDPNFIQADILLGFAALESGDIEQAQTIVNKWLLKQPDSIENSNLQGYIYLKQKKLDEAKVTFERSLVLAPDNILAVTQLINIAYNQNNIEEAKNITERSIVLHPRNVMLYRKLFELSPNEDSLVRLNDVYANSKRLPMALLLAEAQIKLAQHKGAITTLNEYPPTIKLPKSYWQMLLIANKQLDNNDKVDKLLEQWIRVNPYHLEPVFFLANKLAEKRNIKQALTVVNNAFVNHEKNLPLKLLKMELLLSDRQAEQARTLYTIIESESLLLPVKEGMLGRIYLIEKNYKKSIPLLTNFYTAYPTSANVVKLVAAYSGDKQLDKSIDYLTKYLSVNENDLRVRALLANFYTVDDHDKALIEYEIIIKENPKNFIISNNLAWLYLEKGDVEQAVVYSKQAFALAPKVANVNDTYSQVLLKLGKKEEALARAKDAYNLSQGRDVTIALNYCQVLIENNLNDDAKGILDKVMPSSKAEVARKKDLIGKV